MQVSNANHRAPPLSEFSNAKTVCIRKRKIKCDQTKPHCRRLVIHSSCVVQTPDQPCRCLSGGRECGGYAANPRTWLFQGHNSSEPDPHLHHRESNHLFGDDPSDTSSINSPAANLLKVPYRTREDRFALEFWLKMTSPEATDPPYNALHSVFGNYLPQAAWHDESVRHGLLSAASTALSLEGRSGDSELEAAMAKNSAVETRLAIQTLLEQKETAISTVITCLMLTFNCGWSGKWDDYCFHLCFCLRLTREVKLQGQHHIDTDLITCVETMVACTEAIPPAIDTTQPERLAYSHSIVVAAKHWMDLLMAKLERRHASETLRSALRYHRSRINWILSQWKGVFPDTPKHHKVEVETSPYAAAHQNVENLWSSCEAFSLPLLTMQLSLALRSTLLYAAQGDSKLLRDTAFACHCPGEMVI